MWHRSCITRHRSCITRMYIALRWYLSHLQRGHIISCCCLYVGSSSPVAFGRQGLKTQWKLSEAIFFFYFCREPVYVDYRIYLVQTAVPCKAAAVPESPGTAAVVLRKTYTPYSYDIFVWYRQCATHGMWYSNIIHIYILVHTYDTCMEERIGAQ